MQRVNYPLTEKELSSYGSQHQYIIHQSCSWEHGGSTHENYNTLQPIPPRSYWADDPFSSKSNPDERPEAVIVEETDPVGNVKREDASGDKRMRTSNESDEPVYLALLEMCEDRWTSHRETRL